MADDSKPDFKYLEIRNWAKFQSMTDKNGKSLEGRRRTYILDYCEKETDSLYASFSPTARYLVDGCQRLRGRLGRNLDNDFQWILRQLDVSGTHRGQCTHALQSLITRGFLIPTNEQFSVPQAAATSLPNTDRSTPSNFSSVLEDLPDVDRKESPEQVASSRNVKNQEPRLADRDDRLSDTNTKSKDKSNTKPTRLLVVDRDKLHKPLQELIYSQWTEDKPPRFLKDLLGETATSKELDQLLGKSEDSPETILSVVKWGLEVSNHWFKTQDGIIRNFTDLANAYPEMAKQYRNYHRKGANA